MVSLGLVEGLDSKIHIIQPRIGMKVFALDSFEGMPPTDKSVDAHNKGDFSDTN